MGAKEGGSAAEKETQGAKEGAKEGGDPAELRLSFMTMHDDDLALFIEKKRSSPTITSIDLSFNRISDLGGQNLGACLSTGGFPALQELRVYKNEFTHLGKCMFQGLKILRKQLEVLTEEPEYLKAPEKADGESGETKAAGLD